jgi:serine/threonine protein kinase
MPLQVGQNVGPYRVTDQLGAGGMANVYKAYHARLDRFVSLKVMHQSFLEDPTFRARFEREAQIVAKLSHANIVPVYDFSDHEGQPYLVLKYIEGKTLKAVMADDKMPISEIVRIMSAIADALTYAHKQGVLHRDIKPSNIIMDGDGTPYLTDFGLARIAQAGESTMSADVMLGTPQYISPEQAKGLKDLDARTDVYSFGVVLYEMVCGRVPFNADTPYATIHDHIYSPLPMPSKINPDIPPAVENVLLKALAKEPVDRYQSAGELMQAFRMAVENTGFGGFVATRASPAAIETGKPQDAVERKVTPPVVEKTPTTEKPKARTLPPDVPRIVMPPPPPSFERAAEKFAERAERGAERFARRMERRAERLEQRAEHWANELQNNDEFQRRMVINTEGLDDDAKKELELDLATDEESIRKRVQKRIEDRNGFLGHAAAYAVVNTIVWSIFFSSSPDFPWPMFVSLGWGSGLAAHAVNVFFKTQRMLEKREDDVDAVLDARYGGEPVTHEEYQEVRRLVYTRHKQRSGFFSHAVIYACINLMLWGIFLFSGGGDFPWPMFVTLGWGIGLVSNGLSAFGTTSNKKIESQEEQVRREMERERLRMQSSVVEKRKHDQLDTSGENAPPIRLTQDGELTDSFVEEWDDEQKRKRD